MRRPGIFFVHLMKTGGSALEVALRSLFPGQPTYPSSDGGPLTRQKTAIDDLLAMSPERARSIAFYSVHVPAWVAERVAPDHLSVTVLRDPVERTTSHLRQIVGHDLTARGMEGVYSDPEWRLRLSNYQTRFLSLTEADHERARTAGPRPSAAETKARLQGLSDDDRRALRSYLRPMMLTAVGACEPLGSGALVRALERLDRMDAVGVTERLDAFAAGVAAMFGLHLEPLARRNVSEDQSRVPAELEQRIREDNELDRQLYEAARARFDRQF